MKMDEVVVDIFVVYILLNKFSQFHQISLVYHFVERIKEETVQCFNSDIKRMINVILMIKRNL